MQRIVLQHAWTKLGIKKFEGKVNDCLKTGWELQTLRIERIGLRTLCVAVLAHPTNCGCAVCQKQVKIDQ